MEVDNYSLVILLAIGVLCYLLGYSLGYMRAKDTGRRKKLTKM